MRRTRDAFDIRHISCFHGSDGGVITPGMVLVPDAAPLAVVLVVHADVSRSPGRVWLRVRTSRGGRALLSCTEISTPR